MRLRHSQFRIRKEDADYWLKYMREALDEVFADHPREREIVWKELQSQVVN
jgi:truncated hemoglobin YjbI